MSVDYFFDGLMVMGPRPSSDGKSAYAYAVEGGYEGTEEEFGLRLAALLNDGISASVDTDTNRITLAGSLVPGTYTAYYELTNSDGIKSLLEIGELTLAEEDPDPVTYTIKWCNYDGTVLETDEKVPENTVPTYDGETPTRAADSQYTYAFKGWDKTVAAATCDTAYTAVYEQTEIEPDVQTPKNFADPADTYWWNDAYLSSAGEKRDASAGGGLAVTNYIGPLEKGDIVYIDGMEMKGTSVNYRCAPCNANKAVTNSGIAPLSNWGGSIATDLTITDTTAQFTNASDTIQYWRFGGVLVDGADKVVINIKRDGEWLTE